MQKKFLKNLVFLFRFHKFAIKIIKYDYVYYNDEYLLVAHPTTQKT